MAIQVIPGSGAGEGLGRILQSGLTGLSGGLSSLSDNYQQMKRDQRLAAQQEQFANLKNALAQQENERAREYERSNILDKRQYDQQQALRAQQLEQQKAQNFYRGLYGNAPTEQLLNEQQQQGQQPSNMPVQQQSRREITSQDAMKAAQEAGYGPKELENIEKIFGAREQRNISREGQRLSEEKPQRDLMIKEVEKVHNTYESSKDIIKYAKQLQKLAEKGDIGSGTFRQLASKVGLGNIGQGTDADVAQTIIGTLNLGTARSVSGSVGADLLAQIAQKNPSLLMTKEGLAISSKLMELSAEKDFIKGKALRKFEKENGSKALPLNTFSIIDDMTEEQISKLENKQLELIERMALRDPSLINREGQQPGNMIQNGQESLPEQGLRNVVASGVKVLQGFAGAPSSIIEGAKSLRDLGISAGEKVFGKMPTEGLPQEVLNSIPNETPGQMIAKRIPEGIQAVAENVLPEGYLEPRNQIEKTAYDTFNDIGSLLFPIGGVKPGTSALKRIAKVAGGSNFAKLATKSLGGSESAQERVKLGTMLLMSAGLQGPMREKASELYQEFENELPKGMVKVPNMDQAINSLEKWANTGDVNSKAQKNVRELIPTLQQAVQDGRSNLNEVWRLKKSMNNRISEVMAENTKSSALPELRKIKDALTESITKNPGVPKDVAKKLITADNIWAETSAAQNSVDFIKDSLTKKYGPNKVGVLLDPIFGPAKIAASGVAVPAVKLTHMLKSIATNPKFAKEYMALMMSAVKRQPQNIIKHVNMLNDQIKKDKDKPKSNRFNINM